MDRYDEQIQYLTEHPEEIGTQWGEAVGLFQMVRPLDYKGTWCLTGCLTMIRARDAHAVNRSGEVDEALTAEILADDRIPKTPEDIGLEHLPAFVEWQRRLDVELGR